MKNAEDFLQALEKIIAKDSRYKAEAYNFVMSALNYTQAKLKEHRHVTGQELLGGIREYGLEQFGPLTRTVFEYWGVKETEDFGNIVFNLVGANLLGKTDGDSIENFKNGYDFKAVFDKDYRYGMERSQQNGRSNIG